MKIELTLEEYNKVRRLMDFADWYLDDMEPTNPAYEDDNEDAIQAQEVFQQIDSRLHDAWLKQTNKDIREGNV